MSSWYRRFVPQFSTIITPLTSLLKKNKKFVWDTSCEKSWTTIKNHLISAPVLSCPDFEREFVIQTDASDFGIGAILTQQYEDGEKVISYLSRSLTRQERNFSTTEKECLAVLWAVEKLRPYIEGVHFRVITDHYSLVWLYKLQNPSGRLARWAVRLQQFDFTIEHRKGTQHVVPDALSRSVPVIDTIEIKTTDETIKDPWYRRLLTQIEANPLRYPRFRVNDDILFKSVNQPYCDLSPACDRWRIVVPKEKRLALLKQCHDVPTSGHLGIYKTFHRLANKFYWPGMKTDVTRYVRKCVTCLKTKPEQKATHGEMGGYHQITRPWETLSIDLVGPLPISTKGYSYILVICDLFSKFSLCYPLRKANASRIVEHLENDVFLIFGVPKQIISDNGVQFKSREYRQLLSNYQVKPSYTAYYHPQANPTERVNRVLKTMLIAYVSENHREWDKYLPKVSCAMRSAQHETTGLSPYFINFGREITLLGSEHRDDFEGASSNIESKESVSQKRPSCFNKLYRDVQSRLQNAYVKSKTRYDLRHRPVSFYPNQVVWRKNFVLSDASKYFAAKLADKFVGPFLIHRKLSPTTYELKNYDGDILPGTSSVGHLKAQPTDDDIGGP